MKKPLREYHSSVGASPAGAAILEAALLLPLLLLLFAGIYDCFRAIQAYNTLSEVAQEAARYAARVQGLEPGTFDSGFSAAGVPPTGHRSVHDRIRGIIATKHWEAPLSNIAIASQLQDANGTGISGVFGPSDPALAGIILLRVTGNYDSLFSGLIFSTLSLQVTTAAPHL